MQIEHCILCGRATPAGLAILGCLICFPCEKKLLQNALPPGKVRRLNALFPQKLREG